MKILVTGASGQLGTDVVSELKKRGYTVIAADIAEMDITDEKSVTDFIESARPDVVVHCAAYTAVDAAESDEAKCEAINVNGTENIAKASVGVGAKLIYISTDYVYDGKGDKPHTEDEQTNPLSVYGRTKLGGELAVKKYTDKYFIVRTSWVFGKHGKNFVKTMLTLAETHDKLTVVCDQIGSPTYTPDLARLLADMCESDAYGVYHATNEGYCSWYEFAKEIFSLAGKNTEVEQIATKDYKCAAVRPLNSRLSKDKLSANGFERLPDWRDALERYLAD